MGVLDSWGWGTRTSESQRDREPGDQGPQARLFLQGTFTYLPRPVEHCPFFFNGGFLGQQRPAVNGGQERGKGREKEGCPSPCNQTDPGFWQRGGVCDYLPWAGLG